MNRPSGPCKTTNLAESVHQQLSIYAHVASAALPFIVALVLGAVTTQSAHAQSFTVLHKFTGYPTDGQFPFGGLVRDTAGNLYGTTEGGGSSGYGIVFKVDMSGKETVLYSFAGYPDGAYPWAVLVRDATGNLYGTTSDGGSSDEGTVFKVDTSGKETVLYSFTGETDGGHPYGGLVLDAADNLYGTTMRGGVVNFCVFQFRHGCGTVFKVDKSGTETVLHRFVGSDGALPEFTSLLVDKQGGGLFGVTTDGGTSLKGVLYALSKSGTYAVLHNFTGGTTDGCNPVGTPAMDKQGDLFGTAYSCGSSHKGIVWKVSKNGTETVLHNFAGGSSDGASPIAGVSVDAKGNLYGDTYQGGTSGKGVVYALSSSGTLTVLHSFAGSDGKYPYGGLFRDANGNLYGDTEKGGSGPCISEGERQGCGVVFKITP
jgi:uncharacterized repeat protein (TIGR03803 family)